MKFLTYLYLCGIGVFIAFMGTAILVAAVGRVFSLGQQLTRRGGATAAGAKISR